MGARPDLGAAKKRLAPPRAPPGEGAFSSPPQALDDNHSGSRPLGLGGGAARGALPPSGGEFFSWRGVVCTAKWTIFDWSVPRGERARAFLCCVRVRVCFQRKRFHHAQSRPPCAPVHRRLRFRAVWEKGLGNTPGTQEGMEWERPQERPRSFGIFVQARWRTMKHSKGMCGARSEEGWKFTSIRTTLFSIFSSERLPQSCANRVQRS